MGVTGVSEFSFGFAFLYEQTLDKWGTLTAAPILPSLQQEKDYGWDAKLPTNGVDFYYQFKLSDYLYRGNAKYLADGTYTSPYFRFSLHRKDNNRQHNRLKQLALTNPNTFYVAPEIMGLDAYNTAFLQNEVSTNSRLIPVGDCQEFNNNEQHYITFQLGNTDWNEHSEIKLHENSLPGKEIEKRYLETKDQWQPIDKEYAVSIFKKTAQEILEISKHERIENKRLQELIESEPEDGTKITYLQRTSDLLSVFYGVTLVIVGQKAVLNE